MKITWRDFNEASYDIAYRYQGKGITRLVGIQRGGLPLAVKLSNLMDIPMEVLNYQTRDGVTDIGYMDDQILTFGDLSTTLFVDDICDSGRTIKDIKCLYPEARFIVLCSRHMDLIEYSPIMIPEGDDFWIDFPWEK
tara:strand:- start:162 stop:572 length:411 start_codon:yes stop_codon:yes gene_type:complete